SLVSATYEQGGISETIYRIPDAIGNLYKTPKKTDRTYGKGGKLLKDEQYHYHYDTEGNLIFKEFRSNTHLGALDQRAYAKKRKIELQGSATGWAYEWSANGTLKTVITPTGSMVHFHYDPLGRRVAKVHTPAHRKEKVVTRWVWDGNTPLHEWSYIGDYPPRISLDADGTPTTQQEPLDNLITWVFEEGSFVPCAKLEGMDQYSIITDYLGTPTHGYDRKGTLVWERELDCYGKERKLKGEKGFCNYLYQGQYVDQETGLAYNRFRYYDPEAGSYISQDPIGLLGGKNLYGYVNDPNNWVDEFGLSRRGNSATRAHLDQVRDRFLADNPGARHVEGGRAVGSNQKLPETYLPPRVQLASTRKGSIIRHLQF
ncbi:MAG TPA: RHS repeat-associated core domain-containing protein, partial [Cytophagales bacterium]|nr:RHS repeat-associated core domain-containing protein [Cytophagales bacterium]